MIRAYLRMKLGRKPSRRQFLTAGLGVFFLPRDNKGNSVPSRVASLSPIRFRNVAESAGVRFVLENHPTSEKHLIESMAGGGGGLPYKREGATGLFFFQHA